MEHPFSLNYSDEPEISIVGTVLEPYDTIIFDLDGTLWNCFTEEGEGIGAYEMQPPFELITGDTAVDINNKICRLHAGVRKFLKVLDEHDVNMGIISRGEVLNRPFGAQPSTMLLKLFDIYKYFNLPIVLKMGIDKGDYISPLEKTLFIDDEEYNIENVERKWGYKIDTLHRHQFNTWEQLLTTRKIESNLKFTKQ